jgi:predicted transcriptional regulator
MARKAVPLRLEPELIAEIDAAAKAIDTNRTYFIEDAIKARLHLAKSYVAMDMGPPKTVKAAARGLTPGSITYVDDPKLIPAVVKVKAKGAKPVKLTGGAVARKPIGWDASGEPIYRGK